MSSGSGVIEFEWGDSAHRFRLGIGELRELQDKCNSGPLEIAARLESGAWRIDDIREPLRLGLIGAGLPVIDALLLVTRYVDDFTRCPPLTNVLPARAVIMAALAGPPLGKPQAAKTKARRGSTSRPSTEPAPQ